MVRVVADTNIYISAILFGGQPAKIRQLARDGEIELLISEHILAEIADVLKIKFDWSDRQIAEVLDELREISVLITPARTLAVIAGCVADNRILECAVEGTAEYIISGDKRHILPLGSYKGITILSATEFINTFQRR